MKCFVVLLILAVALGGCQGVPDGYPPQVESTPTALSSTDPTSPAATPTALQTARPASTAVSVKAEELRGVQIHFWYAAVGDLLQEYESQIAEFNRGNVWGITVVGRSFPAYTNLEDQFALNSKGEALPQAVAAPMEMLRTWQAQSNRLASLDPYVHDPVWGLTAQEIADFGPVFWPAQQANGQIWGIPAGQNAQVLFYNQSWAEELGFRQAPVTPADFRTQACAALKANLMDTDPENDGTGGWVMSTDPLALESWRRALGGDALPGNTGSPYAFNSPGSVKAFTYLRKLLDDHCAWNARSQEPYSYFAQRRALFISGSLSELPTQQRAMELQKSQDRWTILTYPVEAGRAPVVLVSGASQAILQGSPSGQLGAWLFFRYLNLARVQARLAASASLVPSRKSSVSEMEAYRAGHPQWAQSLGWVSSFQPLPTQASWRSVRRMLQDAVWQIMQPFTKPDEIPSILAELDQMANGLK